MNLRIGYFYPDLLNLYGDTGNIEALVYRSRARGIDVDVYEITASTKINSHFIKNLNIVFMGGGPDSSQKELYKDLLGEKGPYLTEYIEEGGIGLFICGSYQLLGEYYKAADGTTIPGLNIFKIYTQHFGNNKPRCIGNTICELSQKITREPYFTNGSALGSRIVGFENHGGRTYISNKDHAFANVVMGHGNNSEDQTEGYMYKNSIGSYFHGPILVRNPHLADYLIAKGLNTPDLVPLEDLFLHKSFELSLNAEQ